MYRSIRCVVGATTLLAAAILAASCEGSSSTTTATSADSVLATKTQIVGRINQFRATLSLPALTEWTAGESCADGQAEADRAGNIPHLTFGTCSESAQNECPSWSTLSQLVSGCLQTMWNEGPGSDFATHGEYTNMASTAYTKVAVGIYAGQSNTIWAVINFAR